MPYVRIWRYRVAPGHNGEFERAYGPDGDWARLFRQADGFIGAELLMPVGADPVTVDRWRTREDWKAFLRVHGAAYRELDRQLAPLTVENTAAAEFSSVEVST